MRTDDIDDEISINAIALGEAVKDVRGTLTLAQMVEITGLSISYLSDIERGKTVPTLNTLKKIASARDYELSVTFESTAHISITPIQLATIESQLQTLVNSISKLRDTI
jgi:transcriptional regulator with XRE-family HTH domain